MKFFKRSHGHMLIGPSPQEAAANPVLPPNRGVIREPGLPPETSKGPMPPPPAAAKWETPLTSVQIKGQFYITVEDFARYVAAHGDETWKLKLRIARERIANNIRQTEADMGSTGNHPYDLGKLDAFGTAAKVITDMLGPEDDD